MKPFEKCPVCGGELALKEVEKLLRGETIPQRFVSRPKSVCIVVSACTPKTP